MDQRHVVVFDVETTGTDRRRDQVIELCVQMGLSAGAESRIWRIKPQVPISPGAQAVHGISMADLEGCPDFAAVADEIRAVFDRAEVLVGYNLSFDVELLQAEYLRLKAPPLDLADKCIVDAFRLWQQCEPRTLQDAHRRFVGSEFEAAHSASADVAATGRVLQGMVLAFDLDGSWETIARICEPERSTWVGPSRHVRWNEDREPVLGFGKHAGIPLHKLASGPEAGYLRWILQKDFPAHVHQLCERALELAPDGFMTWVLDEFADEGKPAAASAREIPVTPGPSGEEAREASELVPPF